MEIYPTRGFLWHKKIVMGIERDIIDLYSVTETMQSSDRREQDDGKNMFHLITSAFSPVSREMKRGGFIFSTFIFGFAFMQCTKK